jgi:hypothetical protein
VIGLRNPFRNSVEQGRLAAWELGRFFKDA